MANVSIYLPRCKSYHDMHLSTLMRANMKNHCKYWLNIFFTQEPINIVYDCAFSDVKIEIFLAKMLTP